MSVIVKEQMCVETISLPEKQNTSPGQKLTALPYSDPLLLLSQPANRNREKERRGREKERDDPGGEKDCSPYVHRDQWAV